MNANHTAKLLILLLFYGSWGACAEEDFLEGTLLNCANPVPFDACGGDLTGLWQATSSCVTEGGTLEGDDTCGAPTIVFEMSIAGSLTFSADGTTDASTTSRQRTRATLPKACLPEFGFINGGVPPETCEDIPPREPLDVCADRGEECLCSGTFLDAGIGSGTFETPATGVLVITRSDGTQEQLEYCVRDRFLDTRITRVTPIGTNFIVVTRWLN